MAPSKKILTFLLSGSLVLPALSACGTQEAGAAAIVDGTTISDKALQNASTQLNTLAQGQQQKLTPSVVLLNLILAPYVLAEAARTGKPIPDAQARQVIAKVPNPSRLTVDFVRMQLAIQSLNDVSKASILTKLDKAKITVNPRYGTFDAKNVALTPTTPNWIKSAAASPAK